MAARMHKQKIQLFYSVFHTIMCAIKPAPVFINSHNLSFHDILQYSESCFYLVPLLIQVGYRFDFDQLSSGIQILHKAVLADTSVNIFEWGIHDEVYPCSFFQEIFISYWLPYRSFDILVLI